MSSPDDVPVGAVRSGRTGRARRPVVAVTGAASGLGAAVAARLAANPDVGKVVGLDDRRGQAEGVTWRVLDIRDPALADQARQGRHRRAPGRRHHPGGRPARAGRAQRARHPDGAHRGRGRRRTPGGALHVGDGLRRAGRTTRVPLAEDAPLRAVPDGGLVVRLAGGRAAGGAGAAQPPRPAGDRRASRDRGRARRRQRADPALRGPAAAGRARLPPRWQFCHVDDLACCARAAPRSAR